MVWSQRTHCKSHSIVKSAFVYLRLIGDRWLAESQFAKIQIDRTEEIKKWVEERGTCMFCCFLDLAAQEGFLISRVPNRT